MGSRFFPVRGYIGWIASALAVWFWQINKLLDLLRPFGFLFFWDTKSSGQKNCSTSWSSTKSDQINGTCHGKMPHAIWSLQVEVNCQDPMVLKDGPWPVQLGCFTAQVDRCRFDILTKGTWWFWTPRMANWKGAVHASGLRMWTNQAWRRPWSGKIGVNAWCCYHVLTVGCAFFFCVRLPVCLSETKEVQAGRNNSATRMSLPVSPGCRSVSITTPGFPSLVPKFRLRRNSTGKHNEIILRPVVLFFKCFFLLLCKLQLERWIYLSFLTNHRHFLHSRLQLHLNFPVLRRSLRAWMLRWANRRRAICPAGVRNEALPVVRVFDQQPPLFRHIN